jgi:hypothetical protein
MSINLDGYRLHDATVGPVFWPLARSMVSMGETCGHAPAHAWHRRVKYISKFISKEAVK